MQYSELLCSVCYSRDLSRIKQYLKMITSVVHCNLSKKITADLNRRIVLRKLNSCDHLDADVRQY